MKVKSILLGLICVIILQSIGYSNNTQLDLTADEIRFIEEHPVIRVAVDPDFVPYEFFDSDGEYKGIANDYMNLISERTGLEFVVAEGLTWNQAYEKAILNDLDILASVLKTPAREELFKYSDPYFDTYRVIIVKESHEEIQNIRDLFGKKVAVQTNSSHHSYLRQYPEISLSLYQTVDEALQAVFTGTELAFVGNYATSSYLIKKQGFTELSYVELNIEEKQSLHFAVRADWPILVDIINKALGTITSEEKITISNRWINLEVRENYETLFRILALIAVVIGLVFIVSIYWIAKLKKEVNLRRAIESDLNAAKEEAINANHIKSTFLARMSHEIRTPLNAITGMAYILKKSDLTNAQSGYTDKIIRASKDMLSIINDILDFSKVESGKIELERISFSLDEVIEKLIHIISFRIEEQKIEFSVHKEHDLPTYFWGDPKRLEQVLLNLLTNAIKFTTEGEVSLSIRQVAKVKEQHILEFSIKDTGIGMTEDHLNRLFIPFNQADSSITRKFGGSGLGLSIVKNFVELMQGTINVYSEHGEGTTFNVVIPFDEDMDKTYDSRQKEASIYFKMLRVLVLEKSFFYTGLLKEYLQAFNIVADFVKTEDRALELLISPSEKPYNLMLIDYDSTESNGIEFSKHIKTLSHLKEVPKIILLLPLMREDLFDPQQAETIDLSITKPIIPSVLYNGITELFKLNIYEIEVKPSPKKINSDIQYHILVVDDNLTNQFIAKTLLEQEGYRISLASNGKEAVGSPIHEVDLILMDLHMPVMDGYEATEQIRKTYHDLPIIAMTADAILGVKEACEEVGISDYVSKPFDPEFFLEKIESLLQNRIPKNQTKSNILNIEDGLRRIGGNKEIYYQVLNLFYEENQNILTTLHKAIEEEQIEEAVQIVHKIKSSAGSIGAKVLNEHAIVLQQVLKNKEPEVLLDNYLRFETLLKQVFLEIETFLISEGYNDAK